MSERNNEREIICIVCPNSCRLSVWKDQKGEVQLTGNQCPRGLEYGKNEYTNPVRTVITTMRIDQGTYPVIPVRSTQPIPKEMLFRAIKIINESVCEAPIKIGTVVVKNILGLGIDIVTSRSMAVKQSSVVACSPHDQNDLAATIHFTLLDELFGGKKQLTKDEEGLLNKVEKRLLDRLVKFGVPPS